MANIPDSAIIMGGLTIILALVRMMHNEVMTELKNVVKSNGEIKEVIAVHNTKLEVTSREFAKIEEHQRIQDDKIHDLTNQVIRLENRNAS